MHKVLIVIWQLPLVT